MTEEPSIRTMKKSDLNEIIEIDAKVLGKKRNEYWETTFRKIEDEPMFSLVATVDNKVVGFIMGEASGWEYGVPTSIAWINTLGVHPKLQKKGIGQLLMKEILTNFKKVGVERVYTLVNWQDMNLLGFFRSSGFKPGDMLNLEYEL